MTLAENLRGRTVVEFPVINVVYDTDCDGFNIIDSGECHFMILRDRSLNRSFVVHSILQMKKMSTRKHENIKVSILAMNQMLAECRKRKPFAMVQ